MRSHALAVAATMLLPIAFIRPADASIEASPAVIDASARFTPLTTFVVNSSGDEADQLNGDGACRTSAGTCTLRAAIEEANEREGADTIQFAIGSGAHAIFPTTPFPVIFEEVTINGATQPGYAGSPLIEIDGAKIEVEDVREGPGIDGLVLVNGNITVRALAISNFGGAALVLTEGDENRIEGCWIGTGTSGIEDKGNGGDGIVLLRSSDNVIGGVDERSRNLIAGNGGRGVLISDAASSGNSVLGNIIGIAADGSSLPNGSEGILILGAPDNVIGGEGAAAGNVIAGNEGNGIEISGSSASGNRVEGNLVGARGADDPGNGGSGIVLDGAPDNVIGGGPRARNWIAGNGGDGIAILGGDARGNAVAGNLIGIASDGVTPRGNDGDGILIAGAPENTIGGPISAVVPPVPATVEPGATGEPSPTGTPESTVGSPTPTAGAPPTFPPPSTPVAPPPVPPPLQFTYGAQLSVRPPGHFNKRLARESMRPSSATTVTHTGNLIGHSSGDGIEISGTGARANRIMGNRIGIDGAGGPAGNKANGIFVTDAPENIIGIDVSRADGEIGDGNAIGASARNGIAIVGIGSTGNRVEGNTIGTLPITDSLRGLTYDPIGALGNSGEGVLILGAPANMIGAPPGPDDIGIPPAPGMAPPSARGNVIAGNRGDGVRIAGDGADGNEVAWSAIGVLGGETADIPIGNGGDGVAIVGGARRNTVSGSTIVANAGHGVSITGAGTDLNVVTANRLGADEVAGNGTLGASAAGDGILVRAGAARNEITGNDIESNLRHGIQISGTGTEGNVVVRNRIRAPGGAGIRVAAGASENRIGGTTPRGDGAAWSNVIEDHLLGGIVLAAADNNRLLWNLVLDEIGGGEPSGPRPASSGISIQGARNVVGPGNLIARQEGDGVRIDGFATRENRILGNWIGLDASGEPGGNAGSGVLITGSASGNEIGSTAAITGALAAPPPGSTPPRGNVIAHNALDGVRMESGERNRLTANHIFGNGLLSIDLGADGRGAGEPDAPGAVNRAQAAPEWRDTVARADEVNGWAIGRPGRALRLELFASSRCLSTGDGEAEIPLARLDVTVGADGSAPFQLDLRALADSGSSPSMLIGTTLSATATDLEGNSSEVSRCVRILVPQVYLPRTGR